jgi:hypothetical protein
MPSALVYGPPVPDADDDGDAVEEDPGDEAPDDDAVPPEDELEDDELDDDDAWLHAARTPGTHRSSSVLLIPPPCSGARGHQHGETVQRG